MRARDPSATRPWQHVLDCLYGYLLIAELHFQKTDDAPKSVNFGPEDSMSVLDLVKHFEREFEKEIVQEVIPSQIPESSYLALDSSFAQHKLTWKPSFSQVTAVSQTAEWYAKFFKGESARELINTEISNFKVDKW